MNEGTDINPDMEVTRSMTTRKEDAASIIGEELAAEIDEEAKLVGKSEAMVIKTDEEIVEEAKTKEEKKPVEDEEEDDMEEKEGCGDKKKKKSDNNSEKAFQKKLEDDSLTLKWIDGKRVKQDYGNIVDVNSKELNGPGIASAEIDVSSYHGKRVIFTAAPNSAMKLQNPKAAPLYEGFTIIWTADAAKDPEAKARLAIEVR
jgi:hypothetical protein